VTTEDEVMQLLRRADPDRHRDHTPVINGTDYLAALPTRSTTVTLTDTEPTPAPTDGHHRWPIVTVAASAVVVLGIGALILSARDDSEPAGAADTVADTTVAPEAARAPEETARGFLDAYVANDADRALTYLTDDAIVAGWQSPEGLRRAVAWNEAAGYKQTIEDCTRLDGATAPEVTLKCNYELDALGSETIGLGPFPGSWDLTVRDGKIVASTDDESPEGLYVEAWKPFGNWIRNEHRDDVAVMYTDAGENLHTQATTDQALQLWEQRTGEYVQAVLSGRQTYRADFAAICATQAAQLAQLTVPDEGALDQVASWNTSAAAILQQTYSDLVAMDTPQLVDTRQYTDFYHQIISVAANFEATAEAATAGNATRLTELDIDYETLRQGMTSSPAGSGLEKCLDSIPTSAMSGTRAP